MPVVSLAHETDFEGWRTAARSLRAAGERPETIAWRIGDDLFAGVAEAGPAPAAFNVPRSFVDVAQAVICHRDPARFSLLYRLLWRLGDDPRLMEILSDPDVADAREMTKNVSRASHKMKAFVRFRVVCDEAGETYVSWFEPAHRVLERTAGFFVRRFANQRFAILTPDASLAWDGEALVFGPPGDRSQVPAEDSLEDAWLTYYASIFNPSRLKVKAMQSEMPKRYWRNLPEASLIPGLIEKASERSAAMVEASHSEPRRRIRTATAARAATLDGARAEALPQVAELIQGCRRCDLWRHATQGIPGEGPPSARLMMVGEQPGDSEDLQGRVFVGPAGQMFDRALGEAGVPRDQVYITNAVKHFKFEPRGKRRLHKTPNAGEVQACRWWLDQERAFVRPRLILALGATAALSVLGKPVPIAKSRGQVFQLDDQSQAMVTMHPSYLLRLPDEKAKGEAYARFVEDLAAAWKYAA